MLGLEIDAGYAEQLVATLRNRTRARPPAGPPDTSELEGYGDEWDDTFAHIAGRTPGGAPLGVTWEEADWLDDERRTTARSDSLPSDPLNEPPIAGTGRPDCPWD